MIKSVCTIVTIAAVAFSVNTTTAAGIDNDVDAWGRTAEDREIENFLATAEVVAIEDIGEGITKPQRLTLRDGDVTRRAIYKNVDIYDNEIAYTNRFETSFQDSFEFEVAAYRVDRLLGIRLVPVTVLRDIDGVAGSVQLWIEDAVELDDLVNSGAACQDIDLLLERLMLMYVLDAVIFNTDRHFGNVLVEADGDAFYLIDHSRSFRTSKKLPKLQEQRPIPVAASVVTRLNLLDEATLHDRLSDLLTKCQRRAILARRDRLVEQLNDRGLIAPVRQASSSTVSISSVAG